MATKRQKGSNTITNTTTINTITSRDLFTAIIKGDTFTEAYIAKAQSMLDALDKRNTARKSADTKDKREVAGRRALVLEFFKNNEGMFTRDDVANTLEGVTPSQAGNACMYFCGMNVLEQGYIKVGKSKRVAYSLVK